MIDSKHTTAPASGNSDHADSPWALLEQGSKRGAGSNDPLWVTVYRSHDAGSGLGWCTIGKLAALPSTPDKSASHYWVPGVVQGADASQPVAVQAHRCDANVRAIVAFVGDNDGPLHREGLRQTFWMAHTSASHLKTTPNNPSADERWRVIVPYSRSITPAEHDLIWRVARQKLCPVASEKACTNESHGYYMPPPDAQWDGDLGAPLDVDALLSEAKALGIEPRATTPRAATPRKTEADDVPTGAAWESLVAGIANVWPAVGNRHEARMALAGTLGRGTWPDEAIVRFVREVCERTGSDASGLRDVEKTVPDTLQRIAEGRDAKGAPELTQLCGGCMNASTAVEALISARGVVPRAAPANDVDVAAAQPYQLIDVADGQRATPETWGTRMNAKHTVLTCVGGKCRVLSWTTQAWGAGNVRRVPALQSFEDLRNAYMAQRIQVEGLKNPVALGNWWLEWAGRAQAESLTFRPDVNEPIVDGCVNLWRGYGVEPKAGSWARMQAFMRDIIASGDDVNHAYILKWCAWVLQNPGDRAEVVLVLRGRKGTGKNTLLDALCKMLGQHALTVAQPRHLTGNFNAHLADCALLFANEAIPPNDKAAEAVLKTLVTEATFAVERKGIDVEQAPNCLSICMASNEDWCVPASLDERRFAVFDVSDARMQDLEYFGAIQAELRSGGLAAMLHDLLAIDLQDWHPRQGVPKTAALVDQQLKGLRGAERVVYQMLASGELLGRVDGVTNAVAGHQFVSTSLMTAAAAKHDRVLPNATAMGRALAKCCPPGTKSAKGSAGGRQYRGYWVPALPEARANWAKAARLDPAWDDPDGGWTWAPAMW